MGSPSAGGCLALAALVMQCLLLQHVSAHPHPPTAATPTHAETAATTSSSSQDAVAEEAGRVLGSSVVTSVSVIADGEGVGGVSNGTSTRTYNPEPPARSQQGTKRKPQPQAAQGTVAAPAARPATVASPAGLMSPDRYEFYTFDETGDLVRRHMTLDEIKSLLAGGDGDMGDTPIATFYHGPVPAPPRAPTRAPAHHHAQGMLAGLEDPEDALEDAVKGVQDVVNNVQNVLKSQLAASKNKLPAYIRPPPAHGAPNPAEAAATWAMILPGIMDGGLPPKPPTPVPTFPTPASPQRPTTIKTHGKKPLTSQSSTTAKKPLNKKTTTTTAVPAASKEEPPVRFTLAPTTEQDIVDTLYTLVSSSPGLKHTASNNASDLPPLRPRPSQPPPRPATPRPQRPATPQRPAITAPHRVAAKPHPAKPVITKPAPSKTASSKPGARPVPKPVTKPFRPAEQVQQRRPIPQQDHAESMVQIVTVPRPVTTTTMAPFVTFIPTELSETSVTTASPSSSPTSPLTSPTTSPPPSPVTSQLTTFATRRPPAISYTYRGTTTTSTETPTFTETVSSADLDMDSRTTAEEEDAESTVTTTTPARTSPAGTSPTLTPTTGSSTSRATEPPTTSLPTTTSPTIWTTNPPTTTFTPVRAVTRDPPNRITTQFATTLLPAEDETTATSEQATDATPVPAPVTTVPVDSKPPVRYTEILTRVPASALVTKAVPEDDAEQTSTIISTLPTTERDEVNALTTAFSKASDDTTEVAEDEDSDSAEQVSEESIDDSAETEGTTKLYLKISSSENNGFLFSSSTTEASAADMVTPTMEVETKPTAVTSSETFVTDQSAASTEHRGTTASLPASSEEAESRTESDLETTVDEETSALLTTKTPLTTETEAYTTNQPTSTAVPTTTSTAAPTTTSTAVPTTTSAALTSQSTAGPTSTSTKAASQSPTQYSAASTTRTTTLTTRTTPLTTPSELSLESSNILTSQVDAPQTSQASGLKMVPTPATSVPTSLSVEVDLNKVDKLDNKVDIVEASSPASQPQPLWTRVPVVSSAEDEDGVKPVDGVEEAVKVYHSPQPSAVDLQAAPQEHLGLEAATATLDPDVRSFVNLCNELAFQMWMAVKERSASTTSRSIVMSPFAATSTLAMVFLGARGPTSGQMNDVLRLDDMVSFNPHQVMWNVTEALVRPKTKNTGVATAALVRELYSDKNKGKLLDFYKERAQQFYEGHVEEITFRNSGDLVRRKTNLLVKRQTRGRVQEYMRGASLALRGPLAAFGANIFETLFRSKIENIEFLSSWRGLSFWPCAMGPVQDDDLLEFLHTSCI
ncbi:mucin-17 [Frankliniella occidentalis]|uniref:Mucin-17 n=1 Tax=Frankliniella occidentalis TaxID=133901 RepID=A0A9C6U5T9_FRAOC|nr:mucin-17 [Frankliniella occidentalis]